MYARGLGLESLDLCPNYAEFAHFHERHKGETAIFITQYHIIWSDSGFE